MIFLLFLLAACGKLETNIQPNCQPIPLANAGENKMLLKGLGTASFVQIGSPALAGSQYRWLPVDGLDDPTAAQPNAAPDKTTTYQLTVSNQCGIAQSHVTVSVYAE